MATEEDMNFKIIRDAVDKPCTNLLQEVLRQHISEKDFYKKLKEQVTKDKIWPHLSKDQREKLYPDNDDFKGSYADFDVSLLYKLIRNLSGIPGHAKGWGKPEINDNSLAAHIERIRLLRNHISHSSTSQLTDQEFNEKWKILIFCIQEIEKTLPPERRKFEDAAKKIMKEARNQENIGKSLTKCKGI